MNRAPTVELSSSARASIAPSSSACSRLIRMVLLRSQASSRTSSIRHPTPLDPVFQRPSSFRVIRGLSVSRFFEVGVALETFFVELQQAARLLVGEAPLANGKLHVAAQLAHQDLRVELDVVEHF